MSKELAWYEGDLDWVDEVVIADGRFDIVPGSLSITFNEGYSFKEEVELEDSDELLTRIHKGPITEIKDLTGDEDD